MAHWTGKILELLTAPESDLKSLAARAGFDHRTFYRGANFRHADLTDESLEEIDLTLADLSRAKINPEDHLIISYSKSSEDHSAGDELVQLDIEESSKTSALKMDSVEEPPATQSEIRTFIEALRRASDHYVRAKRLHHWAATQANLGHAFSILSEHEAGSEALELAVDAYRAALTEWTRARVPLDWAMTQNDLGNALAILGERDHGSSRLAQAIEAYSAALEAMTRERMPLDHAMTQFNLAAAHTVMFDKTGDWAEHDRAEALYREAREVFVVADAAYVELVDDYLYWLAARRR